MKCQEFLDGLVKLGYKLKEDESSGRFRCIAPNGTEYTYKPTEAVMWGTWLNRTKCIIEQLPKLEQVQA